MPEMDGYAATKAIRRQEAAKHRGNGDGARLPIIAVTAHAYAGERENCTNAGMDDYVVKPIDPDHLVEVISRWLSGERTWPGIPGKTAPVAGTADKEIFAREKLLANCMGEEDLMRRLVGMFRRQTAADIDALSAALKRGDAPEVARVAHRIKGASANMCADPMASLAARVESAGRAGSLEGVTRDVEALGKAFGAFVEVTADIGKQVLTDAPECEVANV
jgi:HPt (histidine-containing phosphotransfer) domain-containing protein